MPEDPGAERVPPSLRLAAALGWRFLVVVVAIGIVALALATLRVVVLPVIFALFLAAVLAPVSGWLRRRGVPNALAALAVVVAFLALIAGTFALLAPRIAAEVGVAGPAVREGVEDLTEWVTEGPLGVSRADLERVQAGAADELRARSGDIVGGALGGAYLLVEIAAGALMAIFILFFFLKDGERMWPWVVRLFPAHARRDADDVGRIAWKTLGAYLRGIAVVALVDAVFIGLAIWLIGIPLVLPLAVLTFFGGFFPLIGPVVAGGAAALVALATTGVTEALLVVAAATLVQQLEGNLLEPLIVGRAVRLHPVVVLLAVIAGAVVWGIPGAFLAVPVVAVATRAALHLAGEGEPAPAK